MVRRDDEPYRGLKFECPVGPVVPTGHDDELQFRIESMVRRDDEPYRAGNRVRKDDPYRVNSTSTLAPPREGEREKETVPPWFSAAVRMR